MELPVADVSVSHAAPARECSSALACPSLLAPERCDTDTFSGH